MSHMAINKTRKPARESVYMISMNKNIKKKIKIVLCVMNFNGHSPNQIIHMKFEASIGKSSEETYCRLKTNISYAF